MADQPGLRPDYASGEVERLVGLTGRQLGYWAATGVVSPAETRGSGNGRRLRFSYEDLVRLSVIKRLLDIGMSLPALRRGIEFLRTLPCTDGPPGGVYLTSDGETLRAHHGSEQVLDALRRGQLVVAPGLEGIVRGLEARIVELQAARPASALAVRRDAAG